jgi:hypothetical protein
LLFGSLMAFSVLMAQRTKPVAQKPSAVSVKPVLKISLGNISDSTAVSVDELVHLISLPLKITDANNNTYAIVTYNLVYTKQDVTENEENLEQQITKAYPTSSKVAGKFATTPIPDLWVASISQQLKPAEELFFYDVVVKDAQGKFRFAPNLKIKTK